MALIYERPLLHQSGRRELGGVAWAWGGAELDGRRRCYDLTGVDRRIEREGDPAFAVGRNGLLAQEGRAFPEAGQDAGAGSRRTGWKFLPGRLFSRPSILVSLAEVRTGKF